MRHGRVRIAGGPEEDWGIKMNSTAGEPAPERITNEIFKYTESIDTLSMADIPDIDLSSIGSKSFGDFEVRILTVAQLAPGLPWAHCHSRVHMLHGHAGEHVFVLSERCGGRGCHGHTAGRQPKLYLAMLESLCSWFFRCCS